MRWQVSSTFRFFTWLGAMLLGPITSSAEPSTPEQLDFFEKQIRPVLIESCYPCHSLEAGKSKGGLRVDSADALLKGGDSGPAVQPHDPEASWLIRAIRYTDPHLQMPPDSHGGRLSTDKVEHLTAWVAMGAPDPRTPETAPPPGAQSQAALSASESHWAFRPLLQPEIPSVRRPRWIRTPVDAFVLAKLEEQDLQPARPADPRTLLRRIAYDLTGLPPSPEDTDAFLADPSAQAFEQVVERLLASPHYGERWGRHWLDVARYADTKGYVFQEERRFPYAYTYRDYVIRAFNEDKPYDRFLLEQIAADRLELGEDRSALAAMGFLTLGRRFLNNQNDIIDDRIDVVTRGLLGLTVSCARCHDHKFDPISQEDYYALHGVFASSEEPDDKPLLGELLHTDDYRDFLRQRATIEDEIAAVERREVDEMLRQIRRQSGDYLFAALDFRRNRRVAGDLEDFAGSQKLLPIVLQRWLDHLAATWTAPDPVLLPALTLHWILDPQAVDSSLEPDPDPDNRPPQALPGQPVVSRALSEKWPPSRRDAARIYNDVFTQVDAAWEEQLATATRQGLAAPTALPDADQETLRRFLYAEASPAQPPRETIRRRIARQIGNATVQHRQRIETLNWTHPGAPPRAMVLQDKAHPSNSHVFRRGNPANPGQEVPRHFLTVLAGPKPPLFHEGSGRLELACAIVDPKNPLTARVFVNRVWDWHFGRPLVTSPSDFGVRTPVATHHALLDWLATRFVAEGWSVKSLHRWIVLSNTYRQSSRARDTATLQQDPDNQYLSHFNRQRLDFESLRDTVLEVAGRLDRSMGGQPVDLITDATIPRRTVYGFIDRQNLPGLLRTFDFANPDASRPGRFQTTVPQQALFLMNSPFVIEQATALAGRTRNAAAPPNSEQRIQALFRLCYQRHPAPAELRLAQEFLASATATPHGPETRPSELAENQVRGEQLGPWEQLAQVLLQANELMFVD